LGRDTPDNLIAMSSHGRSGVGRWVLGSVAEKVVQHSRDPVLIIRPR
jgi:nucleotide-binding universal stress UspA family protein